jgi:Fic family protein
MFKDKYNLTKEQNIFLAKKLLVENIYSGARVDGCNVTFPDTKTILDGVSVANVKISDIECILNLRDAWKFLLKNIETPFNLEFICKLNEFIARNESIEWGVLRTGKVGIGGTNFIPDIPVRENVEKNIHEFLSIQNTTEKAIKYFLWGCRSQLFWDGNKRTSQLCANKILISEGKGILYIKDHNLNEFSRRLTEFYNSNDYSLIDMFIYDNCITGIEFDGA